jgi:hypothetical protein
MWAADFKLLMRAFDCSARELSVAETWIAVALLMHAETLLLNFI